MKYIYIYNKYNNIQYVFNIIDTNLLNIINYIIIYDWIRLDIYIIYIQNLVLLTNNE